MRAAQTEMDANGVEAPAWGSLAADVIIKLITGAHTVDPRTPEVVVHIG